MTKKNNVNLESELIYKNVLQNMQDGVITISRNGKIITFNAAAKKILMLDNKGLIGKSFTEIFSNMLLDPRNDEFNDAILSAVYESTITHNKNVKYYFNATCKNLLVSSTMLIIKENNTKKNIGVILVISDITEHKRLVHVQNIFGKYIDPLIAKKLLDYPEDELIKATRQEITVSFCDMNNFTNLCEHLSPSKLEELMNVFFSIMSKTIQKNEGIIDKFIGDAVMYFWGPPFTEKDKQSILACTTALTQIESLVELNMLSKHILENGEKIDICIGIAAGEATMANIGSNNRKSFTAIGNIVNLASRLVGANKVYGTRILLTEEVTAKCGTEFIYREIDTIRLKGKEQSTTIYELLSVKKELSSLEKSFLNFYAEGLKLYRTREWQQAKSQFERALKLKPNDKASNVFLERLQYYSNTPPPIEWNGIWDLQNK